MPACDIKIWFTFIPPVSLAQNPNCQADFEKNRHQNCLMSFVWMRAWFMEMEVWFLFMNFLNLSSYVDALWTYIHNSASLIGLVCDFSDGLWLGIWSVSPKGHKYAKVEDLLSTTVKNLPKYPVTIWIHSEIGWWFT